MAAPWQSAAMASAGGAVSLESRTEINVSGASSPDEVARRVAVEPVSYTHLVPVRLAVSRM